MATYQITRCDLCGGDQDVEPVTVVYKFKKSRPWEADICAKCYEDKFAALQAKSRRPELNNVRPQHKMIKTEITEADL